MTNTFRTGRLPVVKSGLMEPIEPIGVFHVLVPEGCSHMSEPPDSSAVPQDPSADFSGPARGEECLSP